MVTGFSNHGSCDGIEPLVVIILRTNIATCAISEIHLVVLVYLNTGSSGSPSFHPDE